MTKDDQMAFEAALLVRAAAIETELRLLLDGRTLAGEIARPERLMAAMRHGVLNGGKRLRLHAPIGGVRIGSRPGL